jgi:hypothetical protein
MITSMASALIQSMVCKGQECRRCHVAAWPQPHGPLAEWSRVVMPITQHEEPQLSSLPVHFVRYNRCDEISSAIRLPRSASTPRRAGRRHVTTLSGEVLCSGRLASSPLPGGLVTTSHRLQSGAAPAFGQAFHARQFNKLVQCRRTLQEAIGEPSD